MFSKFLAQQLHNPSWGIGQLILAPLWNKRNASLNDAAFVHLDIQPHDRVLEIGFGGGYLLDKISNALTNSTIAGIDISPAMVDYCRKRFSPKRRGNTIEVHKAVAENIPFPSAYFTKICTVNSIFYWHEPRLAFTEIRRTLQEGGAFILCFTAKEFLEKKNFAKCGLRLFEIEEVRELLYDSGFVNLNESLHRDRYRAFWLFTAR